MQLLNIQFLGRDLRLLATMSGWQAVYWDNQLVSQIQASPEPQESTSHTFILQAGEQTLNCQLDCSLGWQPFALNYSLSINDELVDSGDLSEQDIEKRKTSDRPAQPNKISLIGMASLGLKLFKSAKVIKVLLAAGSLAAYSWLFSLEFALALIVCLVFHEYGHIRAMQRFGLQTKGIYLIPFLGGLALTEDKINTRWQDVYISIMGPFFGLLLSLALLMLYFITGLEIIAGLSAFNALLNLFNLLPVLPLDGGHILKSISFSVNSVLGLIACCAGAFLGVFVSYYFGFALLGFLLAIGTIEVLFEWKGRHRSELLPLDRYGQLVSAGWYFATAGGLCWIIWILGQGQNHALALPLKILGS